MGFLEEQQRVDVLCCTGNYTEYADTKKVQVSKDDEMRNSKLNGGIENTSNKANDCQNRNENNTIEY